MLKLIIQKLHFILNQDKIDQQTVMICKRIEISNIST